MKIEDVLVPIDFSAGSMRALDHALALVEPGAEVYLLHVIDADFIEQVAAEGFCDKETATEKLRAKTEANLREVAKEHAASGATIEAMVVIGEPFAEILRVADDLKFSLIVMSIRGRHQGELEEILFGSTAEKVLRATRVPVLCVPPESAQSQ